MRVGTGRSCAQCYVDPNVCGRETKERVHRSSYFDFKSGVDLYYSYTTCNSTADDWLSVADDVVGYAGLDGSKTAFDLVPAGVRELSQLTSCRLTSAVNIRANVPTYYPPSKDMFFSHSFLPGDVIQRTHFFMTNALRSDLQICLKGTQRRTKYFLHRGRSITTTAFPSMAFTSIMQIVFRR